ncbi:MAG: DUF2752 domain-containing protein [Eubacteriales bacterium]|nr:DUF2752 domain-containing protein [Eubacteriales bacterium]
MDRDALKKEFLCINGVGAILILVMISMIVLQKAGVFPSLPCGMLMLFHIYCPGCGGTRAFFALLHGHIIKSLFYNPAVVLGCIVIAYYEVTVGWTILKNNGKRYYCKKAIPVYLYIVVIVIFAVVRDVMLCVQGIDWLGDVL